MTTIKGKLLLFILSACSGIVNCQDGDFGLWAGLTGKYDISKRLETELDLSVRTNNNASSVEQYFAEGGLTYNFNEYISIGGSFRLINMIEYDSVYHFRQKFYFNFKGTIPAGKFIFSGRLMYQKAVRTFVEDNNRLIAKHYSRLKLKASYENSVSPLHPFISVEPFMPLFNNKGFKIKKTRYSAGLELEISNRSAIEASYILEDKSKAGAGNLHVLSLNYGLKF